MELPGFIICLLKEGIHIELTYADDVVKYHSYSLSAGQTFR